MSGWDIGNVSNYIPATVYLLTVTTMEWNGEYLAVSNNDQFSIIVITVLGWIWQNMRNGEIFFLWTLKLNEGRKERRNCGFEKLSIPSKRKVIFNVLRFYTSFNLKAIWTIEKTSIIHRIKGRNNGRISQRSHRYLRPETKLCFRLLPFRPESTTLHLSHFISINCPLLFWSIAVTYDVDFRVSFSVSLYDFFQID